jgi:hypothetical protein
MLCVTNSSPLPGNQKPLQYRAFTLPLTKGKGWEGVNERGGVTTKEQELSPKIVQELRAALLNRELPPRYAVLRKVGAIVRVRG